MAGKALLPSTPESIQRFSQNKTSQPTISCIKEILNQLLSPLNPEVEGALNQSILCGTQKQRRMAADNKLMEVKLVSYVFQDGRITHVAITTSEGNPNNQRMPTSQFRWLKSSNLSWLFETNGEIFFGSWN